MKSQLKAVAVLLLTAVLGTGAFAQDPHFSQYNASPLNVNPAMTGLFNGNYRITAIYRGQWNSILSNDQPQGIPLFRTFSASFDMRVPIPVSKFDAFGWGLVVMNDAAGASEFKTTQVNLSLAYMKALDRQGKHYLTAGFQAGAALRSINYAQLRFGNQFDPSIGDFNPNLPNQETLGDDNFVFFDLGAGIFWYSFPKKRTNYWAGVALSHINRPDQSFYENRDAKLYMKITGTGGLQVPLGNQLDLLPSFLILSQGPAFETQVGMFLKLLFEANEPLGNAFYIGPWYRIVRGEEKGIASDALILQTRFDFASFSLGFAYDLNFSELTPATNAQGSYEVSLVHIGAFKQKSKVKYCPRF